MARAMRLVPFRGLSRPIVSFPPCAGFTASVPFSTLCRPGLKVAGFILSNVSPAHRTIIVRNGTEYGIGSDEWADIFGRLAALLG